MDGSKLRPQSGGGCAGACIEDYCLIQTPGTNGLRQELARWSHAFELLKGMNGFILFMKADYLMLSREQVSISKSGKGDFLIWL